LNPDLLGFAAATFFGTVIAAMGFWRGVDAFEVAIRAGLTFVVTYAAAFLFVRYVLYTVLKEIATRHKLQQQALDDAAKSASAGESAPSSQPEEARR
jgi:hypothetical protein